MNLVVMIHIAQVCPGMPTTIQGGRVVLAISILALAVVTSDGTEMSASVSKGTALRQVGGLLT